MIRTPLRPLARILTARSKGENPEAIEQENLRLRHEAMRDRARAMAEGRLVFLALAFFMVFGVIGARMGLMAATVPEEPKSASPGAEILAQRADITDRNGRVLATNMMTHALYVQTNDLVDPPRVAHELAQIFPELKEEDLLRRFTDGRSFMWVRKVLSPEQMQKVHEIGDPGLLFGPRDMRLYPNGALAAHVLGGTSFGAEGVSSAEVIGTAGVEKQLDARLRDPAQSATPVALSLDLTVQATIEEILGAGMTMMQAKGAAAVLMEAHTGEILSLVSLPNFDPNNRPNPLTTGDASDSPLFNRAVQGVYELGSTFKIFAASQALELGLVTVDTIIDAKTPLISGRFRIKEFKNHNYGMIPLWDVIAKSSNVGTARVALQIGGVRQQAFLKSLGLFEPTPVELVEAAGAHPLVQKRWGEITTITTAYGHGLAASPLHLAAAYASIANGGVRVYPTLLHSDSHETGPRILSEKVAKEAVWMLRKVVTDGTASYADVPGYAVAGKTGTADKARRDGKGYYKDKVVNTFASIFPADNPKYVLIVTLDEPVDTSGTEPRRSAGYTNVPIAAEIIRRTAPLLGLKPEVEAPHTDQVTAVSSGHSGLQKTGGN